MTPRKVVAAWSSTVPHRVLDDGSEWIFNIDKWQRVFPPLPPEALDEPPAPDLGEWPGKPDVPPVDGYGVEILTAHGVCHGCYNGTWRAFVRAIDDERPMQDVAIDPRDVLRWRDLPRAVVVDGRVTGVRRG